MPFLLSISSFVWNPVKVSISTDAVIKNPHIYALFKQSIFFSPVNFGNNNGKTDLSRIWLGSELIVSHAFLSWVVLKISLLAQTLFFVHNFKYLCFGVDPCGYLVRPCSLFDSWRT